MDKKVIGTNAGIIWSLLNNNERWTLKQLKEHSNLKENEIYAAIGWLARENKVEIETAPDKEDKFYLVIEYYF